MELIYISDRHFERLQKLIKDHGYAVKAQNGYNDNDSAIGFLLDFWEMEGAQ